MRRRRIRPLLRIGAIAVAMVCVGDVAFANTAVEYRTKAGFIFNFVAFTTWPETIGSPLHVCIVGKNPFRGELDALNGKTVADRRLQVRGEVTITEVTSCQIIFVTQSEISNLPRVRDAMLGAPHLLITDTNGAIDAGAGINMQIRNKKIVFQVSLPATRSARVALSAKLLRLASEVRQ